MTLCFIWNEKKKCVCFAIDKSHYDWKEWELNCFWTNWFKAFSVRTNEHVSFFELEFLCVLPLWIMWHFTTASCYPHHPLGIPSKRNCVWLKWWKSHGIISTKMALEGKYKHYSLCPIFSLVVVLLDDFFIMLAKVNWFKFCRTKFNSGMGGKKNWKHSLLLKACMTSVDIEVGIKNSLMVCYCFSGPSTGACTSSGSTTTVSTIKGVV